MCAYMVGSIISKTKFEDFTESEFFQLVKDLIEANGTEQELDEKMGLFDDVVGHPAGAGLLVDPSVQLEDESPEGVVAEVTKWRESHGLSGCKIG